MAGKTALSGLNGCCFRPCQKVHRKELSEISLKNEAIEYEDFHL